MIIFIVCDTKIKTIFYIANDLSKTLRLINKISQAIYIYRKVIVKILYVKLFYEFCTLWYPAERIDHFRMEDNATKAGATLKHIVCDMPHAGRNLYLSERATIAESLFPDTLQTFVGG